MAKIEEILQKYTEETVNNVLKGTIDQKLPYHKNGILAIDLVKIDGNQLLFSYGKEHFRVHCENVLSLKMEVSPDGVETYNYIFWIENESTNDKNITIRYIKTGRIEKHTDIDIAYGDDIIFYVTQRGNLTTNLNLISSMLYSWFAFNAGRNCSYIFIETFPNSTRNFRIHGLRSHIDVNIEDGKWVLHRITQKPFPSKYSDFMSFNPVRYDKLKFVELSAARKAYETINLRDKTTGDTIISLWEKYSAIEQARANVFKTRLGVLAFNSSVQKKDGVTTIKLNPTKEQEDILKGETDEILQSSFDIVNKNTKILFKSIDLRTMTATILDDNYPIQQGESGKLEVDIRGNEVVGKRRERALSDFKSKATLVLINLRFAIEGKAQSMLPKYRKNKPLSDRTRAFIKKQFGINELTKDQRDAVDIAINTPDIAVIQGPPGTGKSTVVSVICQRLMELAEKEDNLDKVILVSAFQNDTVEHIASKIYTNGLPTIKVGKDVQGIKAEESFIFRMRNSMDEAIHKLAPKTYVSRTSVHLSDLYKLLETENNETEVKEKINSLISTVEMSEDLHKQWENIIHAIKVEYNNKDKLIAIVKGLRLDANSYSDDGFLRIRKLLKSGLPLSDKECEFLENAPLNENDLTEDYIQNLRDIQDKYLNILLANENKVKGSVNTALKEWIKDAIEEFKEKEIRSYEDVDTFLTATLESLREDLFGNTQYIKETIQQYAQSIAATNQYAGSMDVTDNNYENVILEEAARSNPLDLLIPMARSSERIIMVGDQFQLPHLLENDIVDEATKDNYELRKKYKESLFGIIFNNLENANPVRRITLTNQFRMHPVIGEFISQTYYNGTISSEMVDASKKLHGLDLPWAKNKVVISCHVPKLKGLEQRDGKSKSRRCEARRIVELLKEFQHDKTFNELNIGIITFYSKQVDLINEEAAKFGFTEMDSDGTYKIKSQYQMTSDGREKLRIGSVDSFQGKEFDIVILSTVRSNNYKRIDENNLKVFGFLTLANRLNVAFSRAQKLIIAVGDMDMFSDEFAEIYVKGLYEFYKLTTGIYGSRIQ